MQGAALGVPFEISATGDALRRRLRDLHADLLDDVTRASPRCLGISVEKGSRHRVELDGDFITSTGTVTEAVGVLLGLLNSVVFIENPRLVVHAGAVARGGLGVVLPGASGSGKSTLTAGLVRAGFSYLSDEGAGFDTGSSVMQAYPRPITLEKGVWPLFPELAPAPFADGEHLVEWFVPASSIRPDAPGGPCPMRVVVFPRYEPGASTRLEPVGRAEALTGLVRNTMQFSDRTRRALDHFAVVLKECECYRLTMGALDPAVELVNDLVDRLA